ncbi:hypothetical protein [Prescottella agglutinans]|uniref:Uncharacterized protein n=1 Tax=Prescottella agglutinans TaxID=1644129 RepID=A0ABT6MID5_9NOCA|nr:hypothetical protein [Prescottella agglutinans]MDH6284083.1 hypothetical protein [Prescottella agglutinans]
MHAYATAAQPAEITRNQAPPDENASPGATEANTLHPKNATISRNTAAAEQNANLCRHHHVDRGDHTCADLTAR